MNDSSKGIAIEDALSILTLRKPHQHSDCNCIGDSAKHMGQTIDLLGTTSTANEQNDEEMKKETLQIKRAVRQKKVQNELNDMSERELLQAVLKVQEDRVKTYTDYET